MHYKVLMISSPWVEMRGITVAVFTLVLLYKVELTKLSLHITFRDSFGKCMDNGDGVGSDDGSDGGVSGVAGGGQDEGVD